MKRCKLCSHSAYTEKGERICQKYLYNVEDKVYVPCTELEIHIKNKYIYIALAVVLVLIISVVI